MGWINTLFESTAQMLGMTRVGDIEHDLECSIEHSILKRRMECSVEIAFLFRKEGCPALN